MRPIRSFLIFSVFFLLATVTFDASACVNCKFSPDRRFGFCRDAFWIGTDEGGCTEIVVDPTSGRTTCQIGDQTGQIANPDGCDWRGQPWPYPGGNPPPNGGGGTGGSGGGSDDDCWWPGLYGGCILAL